jgi:hypothetical protein
MGDSSFRPRGRRSRDSVGPRAETGGMGLIPKWDVRNVAHCGQGVRLRTGYNRFAISVLHSLRVGMRRILLGLLVVVLASPVDAQNRSTLDDPIGEFRIPNPLPPCVIESVITRLAQTAKVLVGFENVPQCASNVFPLIGVNHTPPDLVDNEDLTGITARQALDHLMTLTPTYRWQEIDQVAVIRPAFAWNDPDDALNRPADSFNLTDTRLGVVLRTVMAAPGPRSDDGPGIGRRFALTFPGGTILEALNAIIRAHENVGWYTGLEFPYSDGSAAVRISLNTFETSAVGVDIPLARLHGRQ